ncbi:MAG: DUF4301 family protein [Bacteroidales bacterium]|nr:DUF4301 family protein [Bacteroidales bacterium]
MTQLSGNDLLLLQSKGIEKQQIDNQISYFKKGFPFIRLISPATEGHGMIRLQETEADGWVDYFELNKDNYTMLKFVPASGAASRMFKHLFEFLQEFDGSDASISKVEGETGFNTAGYFLKNLEKFAFFNDLSECAQNQGYDLNELRNKKQYHTIIQLLLNETGLGYASLPKALLVFHQYPGETRLALDEHLIEAMHYALDEDRIARVHFTISPEHKSKIELALKDASLRYGKLHNLTYHISLSDQKPSTDTIAVDHSNEPFRNPDGSLVFRPGGHGALIENMNDLEEDIIFIKNIDNIVPDRLRGETYRYKKAFAGMLLDLQEKTFDFLDVLDSGNLEHDEFEEIRAFASQKLMIDIPASFDALSEIEKIDYLFNKLNRPIRVCGMVKNEGEPGGGPFWVENADGELSLQIVESSQMNLTDPKQKEIVSKSTHFNPVDLVCGVYDFRGDKFNLKEFIDPETGFISIKSKDGRDLKALELPGLWNGAMADWITIFVEAPIITFNPVKTVNDLLRPQHQPK